MADTPRSPVLRPTCPNNELMSEVIAAVCSGHKWQGSKIFSCRAVKGQRSELFMYTYIKLRDCCRQCKRGPVNSQRVGWMDSLLCTVLANLLPMLASALLPAVTLL